MSDPAATPRPRVDDWWGEVRAVLVKDLRSELRTKATLGGIAVFSLTTMVLMAFLVQPDGEGLTQFVAPNLKDRIRDGLPIFVTGQSDLRAELLSALYWVVLYFSAMAAIPRVFLKEEELGTASALRLMARPSAVFTGKLCFNCLLLLFVTVLLLPPYLLFFKPGSANVPQVGSWPLFLAHVFIGGIALAGGATLLGAIAARAQNRGYLMVVLGFGPLLPILVLSVNGTTAALQGSGSNNLVTLVSYLIVMILGSAVLFPKVWEA